MRNGTPPVTDLILVGGGHSHIQVLRSLGMRPLPGARVTMISREVFTPYSGMLPGHVAGRYDWRDMHIDLGPLSRFAGARLLADEVVRLDPVAQILELSGHPPLHYDLLSINSGAAPAGAGGQGAPVKPIGRFLPQWRQIRSAVEPGHTVTLVGGGAGGVELALAMRRTLPAQAPISLVTERLLPGLAGRAVARLERALERSGVRVERGFRVSAVEHPGQRYVLRAEDGRLHETDHLVWVTGVAAPEWLRNSGLAVDGAGFALVDEHLRSTSHDNVFGAGDAVALGGQPRPKAGVFAVREGPVLAENLRRAVYGQRLKRFRAQRRYLVLIGTGDGRAVAARGEWAAEGRWAWWWKDWIDRRFMSRFTDLPAMPEPRPDVPRSFAGRLPEAMRCGGCGAKLGADPLRRVLARLPDQRHLEARNGVSLGIGDDAAVVDAGVGELVLTVDGFRSLVDDPYRFGRITAHHSLNDVLAMGARGIAALAMATVPLMAEAMMEDELFALLCGAVAVLNEQGVPLVGGHSAEGSELSLALTITGRLDGPAIRKSGLRRNDALILTKPLGTGCVLAAQMRGQASSDRVAAAITSMDTSNAPALAVLREHGLTALTDVSGFGLIGHLGEMLRASGTAAELFLAQVPQLPGARTLMAAGLASSLQISNELALADFDHAGIGAGDPDLRLLADPQTSGGLLAGVPGAQAAACVAALAEAGFPEAAVIGTVTDRTWRIVPGETR